MDRGSPALPLETRMDTGLAMTHHESITWIKTQYLFKAASDSRRMVHIVHMVHTAARSRWPPATCWPPPAGRPTAARRHGRSGLIHRIEGVG